jgi:hypothetical protein
LQQFLFWGDASQGHMGPFCIVSPKPFGCGLLGMGNGFEDVLIQPLMPHGSVEALNVRILRWLARLNEQ